MNLLNQNRLNYLSKILSLQVQMRVQVVAVSFALLMKCLMT